MPAAISKQPIDYKQLDNILSAAREDQVLFKAIVNTPFEEYQVQLAFLFLGIIVLLLVDPQTNVINRTAISTTDFAQQARDVSAIPFEKIKIELKEANNTIAQAIRSQTPQGTTDWKSLFVPVMTARQGRFSQANAGIAYSIVYPFEARHGGALIFSYYQYKEMLGSAQEKFMRCYIELVVKHLS
jgi:hypothetical protein